MSGSRGRSSKAQKRSGNNNGRKKAGGRRKGSGKSAAKYWGDPAKLPEPISGLEMASDPVAVVNSLGRPPIPGQENVASHYFRAVYTSAVQLGGALATAGDLLAKPDDDPVVEVVDD